MDAITITNGNAEIAYVGEKPWHGLGNEVQPGISIDEMRAKAGMLWSIERGTVHFKNGGDEYHPFTKNEVLYRSDTKRPLSIVSKAFKVVQPGDVLEFFRDLCDHNGFQMRTAGTLFGGRKFWALADIGADSYVENPKNKVTGRLLLATACDGSMATIAKFVAEVVVCQNTLTAALSEGGQEVRTSHRAEFSLTQTKTDLGLGVKSYKSFIESMRELAKVPVDRTLAQRLTADILLKPSERKYKEARQETLESKPALAILTPFLEHSMTGADEIKRGTAWSYLNCVTEYVDHLSPTRNAENRFNKSMFGKHDRLKTTAANRVFELIK